MPTRAVLLDLSRATRASVYESLCLLWLVNDDASASPTTFSDPRNSSREQGFLSRPRDDVYKVVRSGW